jgi:sec-independent protein translocase protein TatC
MTSLVRRPAQLLLRRRKAANPDGRMPVLDHLRELRRRVIVVLIIVAAGAVLGWYLYNSTLQFLEHPYCRIDYHHRFPGTKTKTCELVYTNVLDGFTTRLKVAVISGAVFTAPLWLYQIWAFITPGLKRNERKYTVGFIIVSTVLFLAGMALAYAVLSKGLSVLINAAGSGTQALLTVNEYLSFVTLMLVIFGAAFELPLIVVMANLAGVLPARILRKTQRISIFLIFLFAAVATPSTDPFTMCAMAVPMVLLFEGAVVFATVHDRRKARRKAAEAEAAAASALSDDVASSVDPIPERLEPVPAHADASDWADST